MGKLIASLIPGYVTTVVGFGKYSLMVTVIVGPDVDIDPDDHKLQVDGRIDDVDIVIRERRAVVEFDGAYWHSHKVEGDRAKTEAHSCRLGSRSRQRSHCRPSPRPMS